MSTYANYDQFARDIAVRMDGTPEVLFAHQDGTAIVKTFSGWSFETETLSFVQ